MKLILAAEYNDEASANIAQGMLENNGIKSNVEGSNMVSLYPGAQIWNPVRLMVREEDLAAATELLRDHSDNM